jgi:hypothetical protein
VPECPEEKRDNRIRKPEYYVSGPPSKLKNFTSSALATPVFYISRDHYSGSTDSCAIRPWKIWSLRKKAIQILDLSRWWLFQGV